MNGIIRGKNKFFFTEAAFDAWVNIVNKEKVVADANEAKFAVFDFRVQACKLVKDFIAYFFDKLVNFIKNNNENNFLFF